MSSEPAVLVVDDDAGLRDILAYQLRAAGFAVDVAVDGIAAKAHIEGASQLDLVLTDVRMPGLDGLGLMEWIKRSRPELEVILISAHGDVEKAVAAMRAGAADYLTKPVKRPELIARVQKVLGRVRLQRENRRLRRELGQSPLDRLVGSSSGMVRLKSLIRRVARSDATVLVLGESGTGKELVARAVHGLSERGAGAFVTVNCGAIPADLLESELFGHERGAFTGAVAQRIGRVERAAGGTLFLDEVAELRPEHQVKLLRALQEHQLERVGGAQPIDVDVRVIAATHRDLAVAVEAGEFREDLYYRLAVVPVEVPPLRTRPGDIGLLARHFLRQNPRALRMTSALEAALETYDWPGNVRELQNAVERMAILCAEETLDVGDFQPAGVRRPGAGPLTPGAVVLPDTPFSLPELERELVLKALEKFGGNRSQAARYLGVPRHVLLYRLEKYGKEKAS